MSIEEQAAEMKLTAPQLAAAGGEKRSAALTAIAKALEEHREEIFAANKKDLAAAKEKNVSPQIMKRLKFDEGKLTSCLEGIRQLAAMPDPVGKVLLKRQLDEGLILKRISVPIGVIGVIFEARPDALVQISALCIRSGNCAILKGGSETALSNRTLFDIINNAAVSAGLPAGCLYQAESHSDIDELLRCDGSVDLLIPRGSNAFVRYIMDHTKIPVMGHAEGVCHVYVDRDA
ncbi:MAG: aldehyde dehydrogenase family protein, partial [Lachnospiraceae bacterium]